MLLIALFPLLGGPQLTRGGDWPKWGGPGGDFKVAGAKLADRWPADGLKQLWKKPLGDGYSSIVAAHERLFTMFRRDEQEHVVCLNAHTGDTIWEHRHAATFLEGANVKEFGPGPLATPLIVSGRTNVSSKLCAVGVTGILHCLELERGKVLWRRELVRELKGTNLYRGYSASPISYGQTVILPVGGPGSAVVAFNLKDGSIAWRTQDFAISHVSPILVRFGGADQLVVLGEKTIVGLDPLGGKLLWQHPHPINGGYVSSTPVFGEDGRLVFSAAYGEGSRCLQLTQTGEKTTVKEVWHNTRLRVHHSNVIRVGDFVYGPSGDFAAIAFTALDVTTGKIVWQDRRVGRATCLYAGGKVLMLEEDGTLRLATLSPEGLKIQATQKLFDGRAWTAPTLVGQRLFVRDREAILALELPR